ncbi:MAG: 16S rRNA (guanine(966)-N(2))-methyltransferase RsmD [Candidatus Delongbacteria bacterium]|nr:16S rRNA (guanine(966)-N(2))-methyltransferase RsmD [Candidatus Delongbacteria bacterium]MBN2836777.1 16S rRNA (guanine(966)-N(2))-methyltransferase RsmD [Candidatus Delongbacteria bacterium]
MIKITGGKYRGRNLKFTLNKELRPTTSFFRQWIFNVLQNHLNYDDLIILDLFSGSGVVGIEFLSRGASKVTFIDQDRNTNLMLSQFLKEIGETSSKVLTGDVLKFIETNDLNDFNIIFFDPPYKTDFLYQVLEILNKKNLKSGMLLIFETSAKSEIDFTGFKVLKEKSSGTTKMVILEKL